MEEIKNEFIYKYIFKLINVEHLHYACLNFCRHEQRKWRNDK